MAPHRLAGRDAVARDDLLVAALLLRVEQIAANRERRPAGADRPPPHLHRRRRGPIGVDANAVNDAVAIRSAESRPLGRVPTSATVRRRGASSFCGAARSRVPPASPPVFAGASVGFLCAVRATAGAAAAASARSAPRASSSSSGVGVHRQCMHEAAALHALGANRQHRQPADDQQHAAREPDAASIVEASGDERPRREREAAKN